MPTVTNDVFDLDIRLGSYDAYDLPEAATRRPITRGGSLGDYCCTDNCCTENC